MIILAIKKVELRKEISKQLKVVGAEVSILDFKNKNFLKDLYNPVVSAIVTDAKIPTIPDATTIDILNSFSNRIPVLVLKDLHSQQKLAGKIMDFSSNVTIIDLASKAALKGVISTLAVMNEKGAKGAKEEYQTIPHYNIQLPSQMLTENGALGIVTIDASNFSKLGVEYGNDVYVKVKEVFSAILFNMWGKKGAFRQTDLIFRQSLNSNTYVIFMNRSRNKNSLPLPGALEKIAERLSAFIQRELWKEIFSQSEERKIPTYVRNIPLVGVGFCGVINNPCIDSHEIIEKGLNASFKAAVVQPKRTRERQRELMQTLIQSEKMLYPKFQGIFHLENITKEIIEESEKLNSIGPLKNQIFGFESLIRIDQPSVDKDLKLMETMGIEAKYLRPDILLDMAKSTKVALELDQACLNHAIINSNNLPGMLMVNILPRNLYYIDKLAYIFNNRENIMFEVSESEAINNFDLMLKARNHLETLGMGIAADDFGKGFSSLERIIKLKPHIIKFDRSMIENIHADKVKQAYVKGMVIAAKILQTVVLAEGVERWEEAEVLQQMGIELIQGFLFHRPEDAKSIEEALQAYTVDTVA